ncbi:hypothetical protein K1719_044922 [Acacia pycnantha]|nr:hypothetical protein K1719_044922 [Acacia pycnantha]
MKTICESLCLAPLSLKKTTSPKPTVEVDKKPRDRPRGSKNKPNKEAVCPPVTHVSGDVMASYILEVPYGNNIVRDMSHFCIRKNTSLCVLAASGTIANASLCPSSAAFALGVAFPGHHAILSMPGAIIGILKDGYRLCRQSSSHEDLQIAHILHRRKKLAFIGHEHMNRKG